MDTIMEDVEGVQNEIQNTGTQTLRKQLGGPTGRRMYSSTSTALVGDTVSKPNNELITVAVAERLHKYIKDSSVAGNISPSKVDRNKKAKSSPPSENLPPQHAGDQAESEIPSVDQLARYLRQIFKTAQCSVDCTIVCLIFIERLMDTSGIQLTIRNWRSLVAIGMLLASKVQDDLSMVNSDFAVFLPYPVEQINNWERQFLAGIKYNVRVSAAHYTKYYFDLREKARRQYGDELMSQGIGALDVTTAERLEVLSSSQQLRIDQMRGQKSSKLRRAVSDQYCPSQLQAQGEVGLPDAPTIAHAGNFVVD